MMDATGWATTTITSFSGLITRAFAYGVVALFVAIYLAAQPERYRHLCLRLVPPAQTPVAEKLFGVTGQVLERWLVGQFVVMATIGVLSGCGLWMLGIEAAFALGLMGGLLCFIPFVGAILAAIPATLVALTQGPSYAASVVAMYVVVHFVEGNFITPMVQAEATAFPPVLAILSTVAFSVLFGPLGVLLAAPLTLVLLATVEVLYVQQGLGEAPRKARRKPAGGRRGLAPATRVEAAADQGLTEAEAAARLRQDGPNLLPQDHQRGVFRIVLDAMREPMLQLLLAAAVIYLIVGDLSGALVLLAFAVLNVVLVVVQESRMENALAALKDLTSPSAFVIRGGKRQRIAGADVVPGDIVVLMEGDRVPADARLIEVTGLEVDESLLTGESVPVRKALGTAWRGPNRGRPTRRRRQPERLVRQPDRSRFGGRARVRHGRAHGDRPHWHIARRRRKRADATSDPDPQAGNDLRRARHRLIGRAGRGLWPAARRLDQGRPGRHHPGDGDAAGGVSARPYGFHGARRLADVAKQGLDAALGRYRGAWRGDRAVHRQDRHVDAEQDDRRGARGRRRALGRFVGRTWNCRNIFILWSSFRSWRADPIRSIRWSGRFPISAKNS